MDSKDFVIPEGWSAEQARFLLDVMVWLPMAIWDAYGRHLAEQHRREELWGCPCCGRIDPACEQHDSAVDDAPPDVETGEPAVVYDDDIPW